MFGKKKPASKTQPDIRYAQPGHEIFNKRLEEKRNPIPKSVDLSGPWMKPEVLAKLPELRRDFEHSRDPHARSQWREVGTQRREDQSGRTTKLIDDPPALVFRPKDPRRKAVERQHFNARWMAERRDAAMKFAAPDQSPKQTGPEYNRKLPTPKI